MKTFVYSDLKSFVENQTVIQIVNAIVRYGLSIGKSINELGSLYLLCSLWLSLAVHAAELKFELATPTVEVGNEIELSVTGTVGRVRWMAMEGNISSPGIKVTYQAPLEKPDTGFDTVMVSDEAGNVATVKVTIIGVTH